MAKEKVEKVYTIISHRNGKEYPTVGTLPELIKGFTYTLDVGKSWEHEKGNKKINMNPKSAATLVKNLNAAKDNAAMNGYSSQRYSLAE